MEEEKRRKRSPSAMVLLFSEGCCFLLISTVVLALGFVLNFHDDYDADQVDEEIDYTQYWVGLIFFITSFVAIATGVNQRNRWLVLIALFLFLVCILVSLFALVVEGNDWVKHKDAVRRKSFWDSEDYDCKSVDSTCVCTTAKTPPELEWISTKVDCDMLGRLNYIYGGLVCCILVGVFLALSSLIIVVIFIPMKRFTVPVPLKKIKKITVLEENEPRREPEVAYRPRKVEKPVVEEIVVRAAKPEPRRTIVYDEPIPQGRPEPRRTIVYDEPIPHVEPEPRRIFVPIEPPRETRPPEQIINTRSLERGETQRVISHEYDEGRLVTQPLPNPPRQPDPVVTERTYVTNPNFVQRSTKGSREYRYMDDRPAPTFVRREPEYSRKRVIREPSVVYVNQQPRVHQERRLVPVQKRSVVYTEKRPQAYERARPRMYRAEKPNTYNGTRGGSRVVVKGRPRAYSDERLRVYNDERLRVYNDERRQEYSGAKPRVMTEASMPRVVPATTTQIPQPNPQGYDTRLENNLLSADNWEARPATPY